MLCLYTFIVLLFVYFINITLNYFFSIYVVIVMLRLNTFTFGVLLFVYFQI